MNVASLKSLKVFAEKFATFRIDSHSDHPGPIFRELHSVNPAWCAERGLFNAPASCPLLHGDGRLQVRVDRHHVFYGQWS